MSVTAAVVEDPLPFSPGVQLTLLTDLTGMLPNKIRLDFDVQDFPLGSDGHRLGLALDDSPLRLLDQQQFAMELATGYHILRAFLIFPDGTCVKNDNAYVEAEFYVQKPVVQLTRPFMFGQPSICLISAGGLVDFFVHNCEVSPSGYLVRVLVDGAEVARLDRWAPVILRGMAPGQHTLSLLLSSPRGEDLTFPKYNAISVKFDA